MTTKQLAAAGGVLLLVGLLLGLIPGSVSDTFSCGSPWARDTLMTDAADRGADLGSALAGQRNTSTSYRQLCSDALDARGVWGGVLAGLGALALLGAAVVHGNRKPEVLDGAHENHAHREHREDEPTDRHRASSPSAEQDGAGHERHSER
jgi:hypothetical protein